MIPTNIQSLLKVYGYHNAVATGMINGTTLIRSARDKISENPELVYDFFNEFVTAELQKVPSEEVMFDRPLTDLNVVWRYGFYIPVRDMDTILRDAYGEASNWELLYTKPFTNLDAECHQKAIHGAIAWFASKVTEPIELLTLESMLDIGVYDLFRCTQVDIFGKVLSANAKFIVENEPLPNSPWDFTAQTVFSAIQSQSKMAVATYLADLLTVYVGRAQEAYDLYREEPNEATGVVLTERCFYLARANGEFVHIPLTEITDAEEAYIRTHNEWVMNELPSRFEHIDSIQAENSIVTVSTENSEG